MYNFKRNMSCVCDLYVKIKDAIICKGCVTHFVKSSGKPRLT